MTSALMNNSQALLGSARLGPNAARRLAAARHARWLSVLQGDVWLTTDGHGDEPGEDVWISAGEGWLLPARASVVLQGEPEARFQLVEAAPQFAPVPVSATWSSRVVAAWLALRARVQRPAPAPCAAC